MPQPLHGPQVTQPHYPDRRSMQFKKAQREREQAESKHDALCITFTIEDGMMCCWCKCRQCWDPTGARCICGPCPCRAEIILPLRDLPGLLNRGIDGRARTL
jgi:hypothetical protein